MAASTGRRLRRPHPQGREARRLAGAGADQIRAGDQPQDRQGTRPHRPAAAARPRLRTIATARSLFAFTEIARETPPPEVAGDPSQRKTRFWAVSAKLGLSCR